MNAANTFFFFYFMESNKGMLLAPLFKNCIDDIVKDLVTGNCDPVRVGDLSGNCLLYADDIVLLLHCSDPLLIL
jgi:hypothetical protein